MQEQLDRLGEVQVQNRNMLPLLSLALTGTVQSILLKSLTASTFVAELATEHLDFSAFNNRNLTVSQSGPSLVAEKFLFC